MHLVCTNCSGVNRVPPERLSEHPKCGKCQSALLPAKAVEVNQAQFHKLISRSDLPVVVDFWAAWCGPCQMMGPVFNQVAGQMADKAIFVKVNTESEQQLAMQYGIRSIPALKVFKQGQVSAEMAGALPEGQLRQWLNSQLAT